MMFRALLATAVLGVFPLASPLPPTSTEKWTGWFSDKQCARIRDGEAPRPNGTACVRKCLDQGSPAVFISEQARAIYDVRDSPSVKDDVGYYIEIVGEVNTATKTVRVTSVKRLKEVTAMCLLPKKADRK